MARVELPSGGWVDLRDPRTVSEKACRPVRRAMGHLSAEGREALQSAARQEQAAKDAGEPVTVTPDLSDADIDALWDVNDQLAAALIEAWSFEDAPTVETITARARADYEAIVAAAAPGINGIFFDASPDEGMANGTLDPKATSPSSNA